MTATKERKSEKIVKTTVYFPDPLFQKLRRMAYEQDRPMCRILCELLENA